MKYAVNRWINSSCGYINREFSNMERYGFDTSYYYEDEDIELFGMESPIERHSVILDKNAMVIEISKSFIGSII